MLRVRLIKSDNTYAYDSEGTEPCWTDAKLIKALPDGRFWVELSGTKEGIILPKSRVRGNAG
jgi:hypothetical protein